MWFAFALGASALWGLTYIFEEHIYKHIHVITSLAITFLVGGIAFTVIALARGVMQKDVVILNASRSTYLMLGVATIATILAELCIGMAISKDNAQVASLIEITYPIFIAIFGLLLFKENNANAGTVVGGILIFIGVTAIYFFNR